MDQLIQCRLKRMRRQVHMEDNSMTRRISLNAMRRVNRDKLVNEYRKIDFDWFDFDFDEDIDSDHNIGDNSNCLQILFEYMSGQTLLTESLAKKCFQSSKVYLKTNQTNYGDLIGHQFFIVLSQFVGQPLVSNWIKYLALDLIEQIISSIDVYETEDIIINSGLILSVMVNLSVFDIELLAKTVVVIQELIRYSSRLLLIALENGFLIFLKKIIKTTQVLGQRKSTETTKSKQISEKKLILVRHISECLHSSVQYLTKSEIIRDLYPIFEKLIQFKDKKIVVNALSSLTVIMETNPQSITQFNRYLILSLTNLMSKNNEIISSIVVHFWKIFNEKIGDNVVNTFKSLLVESNLIKKLNEILSNVESNRLIGEVSGLLTELVNRFDNSFDLMIGFDIYRSLMNALTICDDLGRRQVLITISRIVDRIESYHVLNYLLEIQIIESLAPLLFTVDPNVKALTTQTLVNIFLKSEECGLKDVALIRAQYCCLDVISLSNQKPLIF